MFKRLVLIFSLIFTLGLGLWAYKTNYASRSALLRVESINKQIANEKTHDLQYGLSLLLISVANFGEEFLGILCQINLLMFPDIFEEFRQEGLLYAKKMQRRRSAC